MNAKNCNKLILNKKNIAILLKNKKILDLKSLLKNYSVQDIQNNNIDIQNNNIDIQNNNEFNNFNNKISHKFNNEIRIIFCNIFNITFEQYILIASKIALEVYPLNNHLKSWKFFLNDINKLKDNLPIEYIIGYKEFYNQKFFVNKNVLIPRSDSELLVEEVVKDILQYKEKFLNKTLNIFEFGVGSGCLIISILDAIREANSKCYEAVKDIKYNSLNIIEDIIIKKHSKCHLIKEANDQSSKTIKEIYDKNLNNLNYLKINAIGLGIDISKPALEVAKKNKSLIGIDNLILLQHNWNKIISYENLIKQMINLDSKYNSSNIQSDIANFQVNNSNNKCNNLSTQKYLSIDDLKNHLKLENILKEKFDIIIANPPYISKSEMQYMSNSALLFEPKKALFAKKNGMQDYITILTKHRNLLHKNSILYFELGFLSLEKFLHIIAIDNFFKVEKIYKDLQGINRVIKLSIK
ncbi:MAG: HemK/PrmC family methyltransferase [Rickettsiales bacterium]